MMTETEAWRFLADKWVNGTETDHVGDRYIELPYSHCSKSWGLCDSVDSIYFGKFAEESVYESMNNRLANYKRENGFISPMDYCFPLTESGAKQRAALCLHFAEQAEKGQQ